MSVVHLCKHKHVRIGGSGSPRKFCEIRCFEIASEAILGQKQSRSIYMAHRVVLLIFGCSHMDLLSQLTSNSHERRYCD